MAKPKRRDDLIQLSKFLGGRRVNCGENEAELLQKIENAGCLTWAISSAIGFPGFVVAKSIAASEPKPDETQPYVSFRNSSDRVTE